MVVRTAAAAVAEADVNAEASIHSLDPAVAAQVHMDTAVVVDELDEEATSQVVPHSNLAHNNASPMLE